MSDGRQYGAERSPRMSTWRRSRRPEPAASGGGPGLGQCDRRLTTPASSRRWACRLSSSHYTSSLSGSPRLLYLAKVDDHLLVIFLCDQWEMPRLEALSPAGRHKGRDELVYVAGCKAFRSAMTWLTG